MRRLIACLGLLAFANLVFAQATGACAFASDTAGAVAPAAVDHAMHVAHDQSPGEAVDESPATDQTHTACPMMGQCVLTIDVSGASAGTGRLTDGDRVVAVSDRTPTSLTTAPELPPPRA